MRAEDGDVAGEAAAAAAGGAAVTGGGDRRRRGRRPADAAERRRRVERAIADLASARVPFTMADVAERAGISRATLYRDAGLRDLVGSQGEGPAKRPVDNREYELLRERAGTLAAERRMLRRQVRELEERVRVAEERRTAAEQDLRAARQEARRAAGAPEAAADGAAGGGRSEAYKEGFAAGFRAATQRPGGGAGTGAPGGAAGSTGELRSVAARLPKATLVAARRTLARQLHPDLFAKDPAAAMLATELLKQINSLVGPGGG